MGFILHNFGFNTFLSTRMEERWSILNKIWMYYIWQRIINKKAHADGNHSRLLHPPLWILPTLEFRYPTGFGWKNFSFITLHKTHIQPFTHNTNKCAYIGSIAIIRILNKYTRVCAWGNGRLCVICINFFLQEFPAIFTSSCLGLIKQAVTRLTVFVEGNSLLIVETFSGFGIFIKFLVNSKAFLLLLISWGMWVLLSFACISVHTLVEFNEKPNHD